MKISKITKNQILKNISIRLVREKDLQKIYEIEIKSFKTPYSFFTLQTLFWFNRECFYVAELEEKVVGFIVGDLRSYSHGHVVSIAVDDQYRGKGIGTCLMKTLVEKFKKMGVKIVRLEVAVSNTAAQSIYKKMGFKIVDCIKKYYSNGEDALIMEKRL